MKRFLSVTRLWILLLPIAVSYLGAASNQVVLWANHDKFPVMLNQYKVFHRDIELQESIAKNTANKDTPSTIEDQVALIALHNGYLDDIHVIMSDTTHLNWLADYIDLHSAIYSPGDLLLNAGDWAWDYTPMLWGMLFCVDALRRKQVTA